MSRQVKIRGVRVSLEGVEVLACRAAGLPVGSITVAYDPGSVGSTTTTRETHPDSDELVASAAARSPDRGRLVGFFVDEGGRESYGGMAEFKRKLAKEMTAAQLPALLVPIVGGFPLTTTGKVSLGVGFVSEDTCIVQKCAQPYVTTVCSRCTRHKL